MSRAQQCLMSHRRYNIVLGGVGVRIRCKDEEVEKTMVFHHIFVIVQGLLATIIAVVSLQGRLRSSEVPFFPAQLPAPPFKSSWSWC